MLDAVASGALAVYAVADVLVAGRNAQQSLALILAALGMSVRLAWRRERPLLVTTFVAVALMGAYT